MIDRDCDTLYYFCAFDILFTLLESVLHYPQITGIFIPKQLGEISLLKSLPSDHEWQEKEAIGWWWWKCLQFYWGLPTCDCKYNSTGTTRTIEGKEEGTKEVTFRMHYKVQFTKPCCSNPKNITCIIVSSTKLCFEDGADPAILMMNKTIDKIKQHKKDKQFDRLDLCKLNIKSGIGSYYILGSRNPTVWRLLWSSAENEMNKERLASMIRSWNQVQQHKDKADRSKNKEWEKGEQYANGNIKSKAISIVANALEQCT